MYDEKVVDYYVDISMMVIWQSFRTKTHDFPSLSHDKFGFFNTESIEQKCQKMSTI